jgi:16S rRNA (guanine966-N2)-methyltransferase
LRIIGGKFRASRLLYSGDPRTRPMKDRIREAVFNLVGPSIKGKHAIDLFAGTGALGFEALSRGADRAIFIERHVPTARLIRTNAENLGLKDRIEIVKANTFFHLRDPRVLGSDPWAVFCSPPYDFYVDRLEEMQGLLESLVEAASPGSLIVVEADQRFDMALLPEALTWDHRSYPPAEVALGRIPD